MGDVVRFPQAKQTKPDPATALLRQAAIAAVASGLDHRTAADALRRLAKALERRG